MKRMDDYIKLEYEQCMSLIKYYDERIHSLVKYASGISSAIPSLLLALFQLNKEAIDSFWGFTLGISVTASISLLVLYIVLVQTRLYFIYPVRQVNSIRLHMLERNNTDMFENQMYTSTSFSAFKWLSSHTLLNIFISLQVGLFFGLGLFSYEIINEHQGNIIKISAISGVIVAFIIFMVSAFYLIAKSKYHPDTSIHLGAK